jgi:hypothetical protein
MMSSYVSPLTPYCLSLSLMLVSTTIVVLPIESSISISYQAYLYILDIYSMRNIYVIYMSYTILGKMSQSYCRVPVSFSFICLIYATCCLYSSNIPDGIFILALVCILDIVSLKNDELLKDLAVQVTLNNYRGTVFCRTLDILFLSSPQTFSQFIFLLPSLKPFSVYRYSN